MLDAKAFQKRTHLCALAYIECDICLNWVSKHQNLYPQSFQSLVKTWSLPNRFVEDTFLLNLEY